MSATPGSSRGNPAGPDLAGPGTAEARWASHPRLRSLPAGRPVIGASGRVVVIAPHPDDEILGCGGVMAALAADGADIHLVAVTDGEMSDPSRRTELLVKRPVESARAASVLAVAYRSEHRLGHPDGAVDEAGLRDRLAELIGPGDTVLAPWCHDGHPDHDAAGTAACAVSAACGASPYAYLVWAWHWAEPEGEDIPWSRAFRVDLGDDNARRKATAAACFVTQTEGPEPVLPPTVLARLLRSHEIYLRP